MPYKKKGKHKCPWMGQVRIQNSKPLRKAFSTKKEAKQWEEEQKNKGICLTSMVSLGEWAIRYLDFAKEKFASVTYIEKVACFKLFFQSMDKDFPINRFSAGMSLTHLQKQAKSRTGNAANKDRKNLRSAWAWGIKYMGLSKENPFDVEKFREERQKRYVPPESDFWKVYKAATTEQDKVMLLAYLHLAARRSELFRLIWDDVNFEDSQIRLYTRKTKDGSWEGVWLPMTEDLKILLLEHKKRSRGNFVFVNPETSTPYMYRSKWMKNICKRAGVKHFGVHALRHLTASILAKEDVPMIDIQTILRHKNLSTTERYIRRIEPLRPALKLLPGIKSHLGATKKDGGLKVASLSS